MSLPRFVARTVALLTAFAAVRATRHSARLAAQETQPHPDVPGTYAAGECHAAPFPAQLPPLDSVVDSASLATALKAAGVDKRLVFGRSEEHTSELQSRLHLVCRLLLEKKKKHNKYSCFNPL